MSALLKDRVWVMLSEVAKRGIYPLHGSRLGVFRIPIELNENSDIAGIANDLKNSGFKIDRYADRIYVNYKWTEEGNDPLLRQHLSISLDVTVEIVTVQREHLLQTRDRVFVVSGTNQAKYFFYRIEF